MGGTLLDPGAADERSVALAPVASRRTRAREEERGSTNPWRRLVYAMQRALGRRVPGVRLSYRFR